MLVLQRTKILEDLGYDVIRFTNEQVIGDIENVSIFVNREELESAIVNIVLNAQNAMVNDGGVIKIYTKVDAHTVSLIIEDDGPGIPKDLAASIVSLELSPAYLIISLCFKSFNEISFTFHIRLVLTFDLETL